MTTTVNVPESILTSAREALKAFGAQADAYAVIVESANPENRESVLKAMRTAHKDYAKVEALQAEIDALVGRIDAANEKDIPTPSADEVAAAEKSLTELRDQAKPMVNLLKAYGGSEWQDDVPASLKAKRKSGSGGSTGKRPRLASVTIRDTVSGEHVWQSEANSDEASDRPSFTNAARVITSHAGHGNSVSVADLQAHAFEVAGTQDLSEVAGSIQFTVTCGKGHYEVEVEPAKSDK